jgi:curved DNA-binding protein CbpA
MVPPAMGTADRRSEMPRRCGSAAVGTQSLSPAEGYVLSQVDGRTTVADLALITGLPEEELHGVLARLREQGLLEPPGPALHPERGAQRPAMLPDRPPTEPPGKMRAPVQTDTPAVPHQVVERRQAPRPSSPPAAGPGAPPPPGGRAHVAAPSIEERARRDAPSAERRPRSPSVPPPVPRHDGPFTADELKRIDTFLLRANTADFYKLLGVPRRASRPDIRTAYFTLAKEFHPDAYFGRDLGSTKAKLERIFRQITRAYEVLSRSKSRGEYDEYLKGQAVLAGHEEEEKRAWAEEPKPRVEAPPPQERPAPSPRPQAAEALPAASGPPQPPDPASGIAEPGLSSPAEQGISRPSVAPPAPSGPRASEAWHRERMAKQLAAVLGAGRQRPKQERRGGDFLGEAEAAGKEEEWGRVIGLLEAARRLGLNPAEQARHDELHATATQQLTRLSMSQAKFAESTGDLQAALQHVEQACRFGPSNADTWDMRARVLLRLGRDLHQARDAAMRAIQFAPQVVGYRVTMIRVYLAAGLPKNARREAEAALEIDPSDHQLKTLLAETKAAME